MVYNTYLRLRNARGFACLRRDMPLLQQSSMATMLAFYCADKTLGLSPER